MAKREKKLSGRRPHAVVADDVQRTRPQVAGEVFIVPEGWRLVPDKPSVGWISAIREKTSWPQVALAIELVLNTAPRYEP